MKFGTKINNNKKLWYGSFLLGPFGQAYRIGVVCNNIICTKRMFKEMAETAAEEFYSDFTENTTN